MNAKQRRRSRLKRALAVTTILIAVSLGAHTALAMYMLGDDAPVDRVVVNITAYLAKKPKDAAALYLLGRVNALAYAAKTKMLHAYDFSKQKPGDLPHLDEHYGPRFNEKEPHPSPAELKKHLAEAIANYRAAVKISPNTPLYHLSLASTLESGAKDLCEMELNPELDTPLDDQKRKEAYDDIRAKEYFSSASDAALLRRLLAEKIENISESAKSRLENLWLEDAIEHYWQAYMLAIHVDVKDRDTHTMADDTPVAQEAAEHYLALVRKRGPSDVESRRIPQMEADLKTLRGRGFGAVTPIIFSETDNLPLRELLSSQRVNFDMDGDGLADDCAWIQPATSILVWDPKHTGVVNSGRRLFGSVTWWIFWSDGYQALAALDDNGDGVLSGDELRGLAVWRDKNGNGISDPDEVVPIEETQIASITIFSTETTSPNASPANPVGLRMKDGRALPTYDWVLEIGKR